MSRWKSPRVATKRAERSAKEAEQVRKEKRNARFMIVGAVLVSFGLVVADYLWLRARAQKQREQHMQTRHRAAQTNDAVHIPNAGGSNPTPIQSHD